MTGTSGKTYTSNTGPCSWWDIYGNTSANYPAAGDPQNAFVDGQHMAETDTLASATGGKFYYDWSAKRIYISTNPTGHTVELAVRPTALVGGGSEPYAIRGLGFRKYASNAYSNLTSGGVYLSSSGGATVENDVFTQMSGAGVYVKPKGGAIRQSVIAYNGYTGLRGNGSAGNGQQDNTVIEGNAIEYNNVENYDINCSLSCGAAGAKYANLVNFTVSDNIFSNNYGKSSGVWCDTACSGGVFVRNLVQNNGGPGIFYEIDSDGIIASNVVTNSNYCINVVSTNVEIYNNTLINCSTIAMRVFDDSRSQVTSNIDIQNNVIAGTSVNTNWFVNQGQSGPNEFITGFNYNSYWRPSSYTMYRWIESSSDSQGYNSTASFRAAHANWEANATDYVGSTDPFFTDFNNGNYTIRPDSVAYHSGGSIPADVAAAMGVSTAAGQTRGAISWPGH